MRVKDMAVNLLNLFLALVESILGLRFVLKLFGANPDNGFVNWVYEMSGGLLDPFRGIFQTRVFENQYVLEFSTLFAMLVYAIVALLLMWLIAALTPDAPVVVKKSSRRRR